MKSEEWEEYLRIAQESAKISGHARVILGLWCFSNTGGALKKRIRTLRRQNQVNRDRRGWMYQLGCRRGNDDKFFTFLTS